MSIAATPPATRWCVIGRASADSGLSAAQSDDGFEQPQPFPAQQLVWVDLEANGAELARGQLPAAELPAFIAAREADRTASGHPALRWVWHDTAERYPAVLAAGGRVGRGYDLRLCRTILRHTQLVSDPRHIAATPEWDVPVGIFAEPSETPEPTLFEWERNAAAAAAVPEGITEALREFRWQLQLVATAAEPARLALLLAAESAGALIAAELSAAGVPWDAAAHDRILATALGARPQPGEKPALLAEAGAAVRRALGDPAVNIDSPPKLLRSLRAAGIETQSTSRWELAEHEHPAIAPLLHYKKLARLLTANGWVWLDEWVSDGRYRPVYIPGGVVTGRWASQGGGALQIPRQLRPAMHADTGWVFVSADVAQLEPRVLAAMAGDRAMAAAGAGRDLYAGIVTSGAVATRDEAKIAVLGAMYGATTGDSGRLVPRLRRAFPAAMHLVDQAAEVGARGAAVSTWLGRGSPQPDDTWYAIQSRASAQNASPRDEELARRTARERGRFTRNFIVQGTAAEWALAWLADLRQRLAAFPAVDAAHAAAQSGPTFARRPHLAFFLHDEVMVHTPEEHAEAVAAAVTAAAQTAGTLLFGDSPVDFPLDLRISAQANKE